MSKIGYSNSRKLKGNIERILEMVDGSLGDNTISGVFKDENINISSQFVREIRIGAVDASRKALSKKIASNAIKGVKPDKERIENIPNNGALEA